jgi:hypothetical protein
MRLNQALSESPISHLGKWSRRNCNRTGLKKCAVEATNWGTPQDRGDMEQIAYMRTAPNGLTEIIFTTGDSVRAQEMMNENPSGMGVPSVP